MLRFLLDHCLMILFILSVLSDQLSSTLCALVSLRKWTPSFFVVFLFALPILGSGVLLCCFCLCQATVLPSFVCSFSSRKCLRTDWTLLLPHLGLLCLWEIVWCHRQITGSLWLFAVGCYLLAPRIFIARISTAKTNSSGNRGHSCLFRSFNLEKVLISSHSGWCSSPFASEVY